MNIINYFHSSFIRCCRYFLSGHAKKESILNFVRWKTGEWTDCSKTCNDGEPGERTREVICVDESHEIETEDQESYCAGPKPVTREACAVEACPAEWVTVKSGPVSKEENIRI